MSAREVMEWGAYEQVYGSILPHERIDQGIAQVSLILAQAFSEKRYNLRDFMPQWYQDLTADDELGRQMTALKLMTGGDHADDQHANG